MFEKVRAVTEKGFNSSESILLLEMLKQKMAH